MSDIQIPELLRKFSREAGNFQVFHPEFELSCSSNEFTVSDLESAEDWFGHENYKEKGYDFHCFGSSPTGSMFCFWITPEHVSLDTAPIVLLTDDGEHPTVLAKDFTHFLIQLAEPYEYNSFKGKMVVSAEPEETIASGSKTFNQWLDTVLPSEMRRPALEIFNEAKELYPNTEEILYSF